MSDREDRLRLIALNIAKDVLSDVHYMDVYEMTEGDDLVGDEASEVLELLRKVKVEIPDA